MFGIFMGLLFLVMAAVFLVLGFIDASITGTFIFLAVLFGLIALVFFGWGVVSVRRSGRRRLIAQTGLAGTATITAMSDTGASVNDSPLVGFQFLVTVPGRPPYPVSKHLVLPRLQVGRVAPGMTIPVKVDANDPNELLLQWDSEWDGATTLMGGAFGVPGPGFGSSTAIGTGNQPPSGWGQPEGSAFDQPVVTFGQPPVATFGQPPVATFGQPPVAGFGGPPVVTTSQGMVIDATGGGDPIATVSASQLDQATLDRINRVLYDREQGGPTQPAAAASSAAPPAGGIDHVLEAIGRGGAAGARPSTPPMSPAPSAPSASSAASAGFGLLDPKQAERLAAVGYTGRATIDSFQETGVAMGEDRLYTMQLTVKVDGRPTERVRHASLVPQRAISRIANGATLPIRVDPLDASQLIVEWDRG